VQNLIIATPNLDRELEISKACHASDDSTGGDRVEALEGPDGRIHLIVLDACGHGRNAEDLADTSLHTVRTLLWQGSTPTMTSELLACAGGISAAHIVSRALRSFGTGFKDDVAALAATTKC
jgi:hypothetical protein